MTTDADYTKAEQCFLCDVTLAGKKGGLDSTTAAFAAIAAVRFLREYGMELKNRPDWPND